MAATAALSAAAVGMVAAGNSGRFVALTATPAPLVAVIGGIIAVHALGLQRHGVEIVGHIDSGLPSFGLPGTPAADYLKLAGPAAGVMLAGFAEGLGAAKTYAARDGYEISVNRELAGLGAANPAAGLSGGMVVNGSLSKTAVNGSAGAHSQVSGLVTAVLAVLTLLFLTGLFEDLPEATLAAVVIAALIELIDIAALRRLYAASTSRLGRIYYRRAGRLHRRDRRHGRGTGLRHAARAGHRHRNLDAAALPGRPAQRRRARAGAGQRPVGRHLPAPRKHSPAGGDSAAGGVGPAFIVGWLGRARRGRGHHAHDRVGGQRRSVRVARHLGQLAQGRARAPPAAPSRPAVPVTITRRRRAAHAQVDGHHRQDHPLAVAGLAAALSGANPKNLLLAVGGATAIAQTGISGGQQAMAYLIFALIGTLGVGTPVGLYFAMGKRSEQLLAPLKQWMSAHNAVIMTVLFLIIAAKLIGDGISGLS